MTLIQMNSRIAVLIASTGLLFCASFLKAADNNGTLQGVVKDSADKPVTGAFVKLQNHERHLTFMVVSQAQGRYEVSHLPEGKYIVQGIGNGYQSAWSAPVDVLGMRAANLDLTLSAKQGPRLLPAWPMKMPEAQLPTLPKDLPEGADKKLVAARCTVCHDAAHFMAFHMDRGRWEYTVHGMRALMRDAKLRDLTDEEGNAIVDYLATNFPSTGEADPNSRLPRALLEGKSLHYRVVQYDISDSDINAEPHDVAVDPQGNGWVGERVGKLGRLNPNTLEFTEIPIPPGPAGPDSQRLGNPQIDAKGLLWVQDGPNQRWLSYDTSTGKFAVYPWPKGTRAGAGGNTMAIHPDGTIWSTAANQVRMLNPATGEFRFFETPSYLATKQQTGAYGMTVAADGKVWFAEDQADRMAKVDPVTGKVEEIRIPFDGVSFPRRMSYDARGDVWVGLWNAGRLMKIDFETDQMTFYAPPTETSGTYSVAVDRKNNFIWVSEQQADKIARFDPRTEEWVEFPLPDSESDPRRIDVDQNNPNRVWWSGNLSARMGFVEVLTGK